MTKCVFFNTKYLKIKLLTTFIVGEIIIFDKNQLFDYGYINLWD